MAITQISPLNRSGSEVLVSQSWKWLTERLAYLPQVRLVFGKELPELVSPNWNFKEQ